MEKKAIVPLGIRNLIEKIQEERKRAQTTFDWLPADGERRRELRTKIREGGRQSLDPTERKEAYAHGLLTHGDRTHD